MKVVEANESATLEINMNNVHGGWKRRMIDVHEMLQWANGEGVRGEEWMEESSANLT
jgi:hypothetical protein